MGRRLPSKWPFYPPNNRGEYYRLCYRPLPSPITRYDLQQIVSRTTNEEKAATMKRKALAAIPSEYVPAFAQYLFDDAVGMTQHRTIALKQYVKDYKVCRAKREERRKRCHYLVKKWPYRRNEGELEALKGNYTVKRRPMDKTIAAGSFGIQKQFIKPSSWSSPVASSFARSLRHVRLYGIEIG
jgi:hypothetical protein